MIIVIGGFSVEGDNGSPGLLCCRLWTHTSLFAHASILSHLRLIFHLRRPITSKLGRWPTNLRSDGHAPRLSHVGQGAPPGSLGRTGDAHHSTHATTWDLARTAAPLHSTGCQLECLDLARLPTGQALQFFNLSIKLILAHASFHEVLADQEIVLGGPVLKLLSMMHQAMLMIAEHFLHLCKVSDEVCELCRASLCQCLDFSLERQGLVSRALIKQSKLGPFNSQVDVTLQLRLCFPLRSSYALHSVLNIFHLLTKLLLELLCL
mmetsp:Transcript_12609/g.28589  ORF Transcript_12609/g.28589 Transcript_12609/m.28589 type:complete len:264 (+) Transcript_12609:811-1602(+)